MSGLTNARVCFGGSAEPLLLVSVRTINLFSFVETSLSNPTNNSDRYQRWRLNAVVAALAKLFGYEDSLHSNARSFLGSETDDGV